MGSAGVAHPRCAVAAHRCAGFGARWRHGGVGRAVLDALLDAARARGDREAVLHAQLGAAPFYERAGFVRRGAEFDEAGIAHVEMLRVL